jgi:hypothetical protein
MYVTVLSNSVLYYNKIFPGYQPSQLVKRRKTNVSRTISVLTFRVLIRDGPWNVGFFTALPIDTAGSPGIFYYTMLPWKLQVIHLFYIVFCLQIKSSLWEGGLRCIGLVWSPLLNNSHHVSNEVIIVMWHRQTYTERSGFLHTCQAGKWRKCQNTIIGKCKKWGEIRCYHYFISTRLKDTEL